ncbi:MAG TPA: TldD/PmbA family protein [Candidatus Nanoarchaeia archaeon]|nr:TldD/PmbA family protein [Candidatus Nanoarchaeia archaeon]
MINKIAGYIKSKGTDTYEIFLDSSDNIQVAIQKEKIDFASEGRMEGLGIRVSLGKKLGFSSTLDINNYQKCVDKAIKIAKLNDEDKKFKKFADTKGKLKKNLGCDSKLLHFGMNEIKKFVNEYVKNVKEIDEKISLTSGAFVKNVSFTRIMNSEGLNAEKKTCSNTFWIEMMKEKGNTLGFSYQGRQPLNANKAKEHTERFLSTAKKDTAETKNMKLVIHPEALAELLDEAFSYSINSENVQAGKSILAGKIGKKIFNKGITITDDSTTKGLLCSRPCDDEGIPAKKTVIVSRGVLKNYLYDTYHANAEGKESTSNAVRSYSSLPEITPSNIIMQKGTKNEEKIISSVDKCIYVKQLMGVHVMDTTTGDFSLGIIEGHIYEKGEMKHAVKDTMVAGNLYNMLNNTLALGNKLIHGGRGHYLPLMLCENVKVIGK